MVGVSNKVDLDWYSVDINVVWHEMLCNVEANTMDNMEKP